MFNSAQSEEQERARFYSEKVMNYLLNPPNTGRLDVDNNTVCMAKAVDNSKNLVIELYSKIENNKILDFKYLIFGDGYCIACLAKLSEDIIGCNIKQAQNYSMSNLAKELDIPQAKLNKLKVIKQCLDNLLEQY